ncbi:MAG: CRISPR system precrRNA processing endoribonuclease RAMP protein Cas6 [Deltaproteobacteria bacterium]|nr:CRISPR system precrRNA processing endoribonuclease RAMP protein Cas6 [Deltaproteobacteria bacterium]
MMVWLENSVFMEMEQNSPNEEFLPIIFRSVIGKELREMSCIMKNTKCADCGVSEDCPYGAVFERYGSYMNNNSKQRIGADFIPEVEIINNTTLQFKYRMPERNFRFSGAVEAALENAGKSGIGRSRKKYVVSAHESRLHNFDFSGDYIYPRNIENVEFVSPLRLQSKGRLVLEMTVELFFRAALRRLQFLSPDGKINLQGLNSFDDELLKLNAEIIAKWMNIDYFSGTQRKLLKMGGLIGHMVFDAQLPPLLQALLEFMEFFHIGKNISFGLGRIRIS